MLSLSDSMTMHEALFFLDWLHGQIQKHGEFTEKGSWPTREILGANLDANREFFPNDKVVRHSFNRQFSIARQRHWAAELPCSKNCHAKHVMLTQAGAAVLDVMNREGCDWAADYRFVREAA
jgi:hypothetical protein